MLNLASLPEVVESSRCVSSETVLPPAAIALGELTVSCDDDPEELLAHRFLCRGGGLLLVGPTGKGKSTLALQMAILWAAGHDCLGIAPTKQLRSLVVQAENDVGDLAEMRDGIYEGLNIPSADRYLADRNVMMVTEDRRTGLEFFSFVLEPLLALYQPDLLWIDPALSYLGGDSNSQKEVGAFLRNHLTPLIRKYHCGAVVVHHTNKPPATNDRFSNRRVDGAYAGAGSAEFANWARAVVTLRTTKIEREFELDAAKRGGRIGWENHDGTSANIIRIAHGKDRGPHWIRINQTGEDQARLGRRRRVSGEEILALLPAEGLKSSEWQKLVNAERGISRSQFYMYLRQLKDAGKIWQTASGTFCPVCPGSPV